MEESILPSDILIYVFELIVEAEGIGYLISGAGSTCKCWRYICMNHLSLWRKFNFRKYYSHEQLFWLCTEHFNGLYKLILNSGYTLLTDYDIEFIISNCKDTLCELEIKFSKNSKLTNETVNHLCNIKKLCVFSIHSLDTKIFVNHVFKKLLESHQKNLICLKLNGILFSNQHNATCNNYLDDLLDLLKKKDSFPVLKSLILKFQHKRNFPVGGISLKNILRSCPQLSELELYRSVSVQRSSYFSDPGERMVNYFKMFSFGSVEIYNQEDFNLEEELFVSEVLLHSKILEKLQLNGVELSLDCCNQMFVLGNMNSLRKLTLSCLEEREVLAVQKLLYMTMTNLQILSLRGSVRDVFLQYIQMVKEAKKTPTLEKLNTTYDVDKTILQQLIEICPLLNFVKLIGKRANILATVLDTRENILVYLSK